VVWINSTLTYFGLAKYLQELYDCELYAIIDVTDRPKKFFQEQDLVRFQKVWFYHDHVNNIKKKPDLEYLTIFEVKYKINLWTLAYNERIFYEFNKFYKFTENEVLSILEQECKLFESIIDQADPDFIIMFLPFLHHDNLFFRMCKSRGIPCLMLRTTRILAGNCIILDEDESVPYKLEHTNDRKRSFEELQSYIKQFNVFKNVITRDLRHNSNLKLIKGAAQFIFIGSNSNVKTHYTYYGRSKLRVFLKSVFMAVKAKYRKCFIDKNFVRDIDYNTPYVFFPLHLEEEHSLLVVSPFYTNQIEIIKNIVKSLPIGYKLYIKESPLASLRDWKSLSEYKKIMDLPNVILLHPSIPPEEIIKNSALVITISGTASLDAAMYNKPSIVFADTPFSNLSSVYRLKTVEDLPNAIKKSLHEKVNLDELNDFVNYIEKNSFRFDLVGLWHKQNDYFNYGGFLVDVDIPLKKMKTFLQENDSQYKKLAFEHIKKIHQFKNSKLKIL